MDAIESTEPAGLGLSEGKPDIDAENLIEGLNAGANTSTADATVVDAVNDESKLEEDAKEENSKEMNEDKAKKDIIHYLSKLVRDNFEKIGKKFDKKNQQQQYDYIKDKISEREKKKYELNDEDWKKGLICRCLKLFGKKPPSYETVQKYFEEFGTQGAN